MKVVENYIWFPVVHENSLVLKFEMSTLELVSKELNHLAAILHVYAGVWI